MPHQIDGIKEMLKHTERCLIITYLQNEEQHIFPQVFWKVLEENEVNSLEILAHKNKGIEIVRLLRC